MEINEQLLQIWDYFLVVGWRAITKTALYVVKRDEFILRDAPFDRIIIRIQSTVKKIL